MSEESRCHVCGTANETGVTECVGCGFPLHSSDLYHARVTPDSVPGAVAEQVLGQLNEMPDAEALMAAVPFLDPNIPGQDGMASRVLEARDEQYGGRFPGLSAVASVPGLTIGRFAELVTDLGTTPHVFEPDLSSGAPGRRRFSASRSELDFTYELLMDAGGQTAGTIGEVLAARCSSCSTAMPAYASNEGTHEARVDVTKAIFDGQDDFATVNVTMDGSLTPYDYMRPLQDGAESFTFPALMILNNNMVLYVKPSGGEEITLVSREVTSQVGKILAWPPYGMRLHTIGPSDYHVLGDPDETPVLRVLDGTTFLTGPSNFLGHHADILSHELDLLSEDEIRAVSLRWRPVPEDTEHERQADYYHVYRAVVEEPAGSDAPSGVAWENVSGPVHSAEWTDAAVPSGASSLYYRVVAVWVTSLGKAFESFPGQSVRIEPPGSVYRPLMQQSIG